MSTDDGCAANIPHMRVAAEFVRGRFVQHRSLWQATTSVGLLELLLPAQPLCVVINASRGAGCTLQPRFQAVSILSSSSSPDSELSMLMYSLVAGKTCARNMAGKSPICKYCNLQYQLIMVIQQVGFQNRLGDCS